MRGHSHGRVQKVGLRRPTNRPGLEKRRLANDLHSSSNESNGPGESQPPIAEICPQANDRVEHVAASIQVSKGKGKLPRSASSADVLSTRTMLDLTRGELFVVVFIVVAVVSSSWWPRLGELVATKLARGGGGEAAHDDRTDPSGPDAT